MIRDKKHLSFIRKLPCCVCLRTDTVQAAHIRLGLPAHEKGGMGMKPSDRYTLPMCNFCHAKQHTGELTFWGDMDKPIELANALFVMTGDKEKAIHQIIRFNRVLRSKK